VIVLDTNVLSELMRAEPAEPVVRWMAAQPGEVLYPTTVTRAEILHGAMLPHAGKRRNAFARRFAGHTQCAASR
jgi:toxin FitB